MIKKFNNFKEELIIEKSIGSESIREKWYSDMDKKTFYHIVNTDPTSIRKKDFSKPGKYTKWLLNCYRQLKKDNLINTKNVNLGSLESYFSEELKYKLFIFSTGWFKSKSNKSKFFIGGSENRTVTNDIFRFKSIDKFDEFMDQYTKEYELQTENAKYDVVYFDDKINILIPINFTASYETAKNTDWCTKSLSGFSHFKNETLLFRLLPKEKNFDKLKLSWFKGGRSWTLACSKYPEITGYKSPFDIVDGEENWLKIVKDSDEQFNDKTRFANDNYYIRWKENSKNIKDTMNLLTSDAKKTILEYYNKYGN